MLITTDIATEIVFEATAGQTIFSFDFPIWEESEIVVTVDDVETAPVAITGVEDEDGGSVELEAMAGGERVVLRRDVAVKTRIDLPLTGPYSSGDINDELDRHTAVMQQHKTKLGRVLSLPVGDEAADLPIAAERAGTFLAFDASGNPVASSGTGSDPAFRTDMAANGAPLIGIGSGITLEEWLGDFAVLSDWASAGAIGDRFTAAMNALSAEGGGKLLIPGGDLDVGGDLLVPYGTKNVTVIAYGATFREARLAIQSGYRLGQTQNITFLGGRLTCSSALAEDSLLDISGIDITLRDILFRCIDANDEIVPKPDYLGYIRHDTMTLLGDGLPNDLISENHEYQNCLFDGSNGVLISGRRHRLRYNRWINASAYTEAFGGDDASVIKAVGESSYGHRIEDSYYEGFSSICAIGSEVGTHAADDPDFSVGVYDVQVNRNHGKNCQSVIYAKAGAIGEPGAGYDYRNGFIEASGKGNVLEDATGERLLAPIQINMGRGSKLKKLKLEDTTIKGRMAHGEDDAGIESDNAANNAIVQVVVRDMSAYGTDSGAIIEHVEIDGLFHEDPFEGALKTSADGSIPGYAARFIVQVENEHAAGVIGRVDIRNARSNGCSACAAYVGTNIAGPVTIDGYDFTNVCTAPPSADYQGGFVSASPEVYVLNPVRLEIADPTFLPVKVSGVGRVHGDSKEIWLGDLAGATASFSLHCHVALADQYVTGFDLVNNQNIGLSTGSYASLFLYRRSDSAQIAVKNTLEGDSGSVGDFTAGVPNPLSDTPFQTVNAILAADDGLRLDVTNTTGGTDFTRLRAIIRSVPTGRKQ